MSHFDFFFHSFQAEIKEMLTIVLQDLRFGSAVVHQVKNLFSDNAFCKVFRLISWYMNCWIRCNFSYISVFRRGSLILGFLRIL